MDISYYKEKYEPIDGKWYINKEIGSGAFGRVFEIERKDFGEKSALKIMTIPSSSGEVDIYRREHYMQDEQSVTSYFYGFVEEFIQEFKLMSKLKGNSHIVSIEDYDVKKHEEGIGWDTNPHGIIDTHERVFCRKIPENAGCNQTWYRPL